MKEYNRSKKSVEEFNIEDNSEEFNGICDDISGTPISSFTFDNEISAKETLTEEKAAEVALTNSAFSNKDDTKANDKKKSTLFKPTPPVDGEALNVQRSYKIRRSTARMLNEIKAIHPDVNVYMNIIVDEAIRNYHDYIFNKGGRKTL